MIWTPCDPYNQAKVEHTAAASHDWRTVYFSVFSLILLSLPLPPPLCFVIAVTTPVYVLCWNPISHNHATAILCCSLQHFRTTHSNHSLGSPCKSSFRPGRSFRLETSVTGFTGISIPAQRTSVDCVGLHNIKHMKVFCKNPCKYSFSALWHSHHYVLVQPGNCLWLRQTCFCITELQLLDDVTGLCVIVTRYTHTRVSLMTCHLMVIDVLSRHSVYKKQHKVDTCLGVCCHGA